MHGKLHIPHLHGISPKPQTFGTLRTKKKSVVVAAMVQ